MAGGQGGVVRGPVWQSGPGWVPMATGILLRGIKPSSRRSIITAACCLLAWATGIAGALQLVKFPTIAMSAFFLVGLAAAALLGLLTERLARFLEATDVIARSTRLQATALLTLFALAAPILVRDTCQGSGCRHFRILQVIRRSPSRRAASTAIPRSTSCAGARVI